MELKLKELRKRAGYRSQAAFAEAVGLPARSIRNWEQGVSSPTIIQACMIAEVLGCTLDELAGLKPAGEPLSSNLLDDHRIRSIISDYERLNDELKDAAAGAVRGITFVARG